jgi:casein kinase II subunit beta
MEAKLQSQDSQDSLRNSETWGSDEGTSSTGSESLSWIAWFCSLPGHDYFCEVAEDYIEDDFNMTGLSSMISLYKEALEFVLDLEPEEDDYGLDAADRGAVEQDAEILYGLVHQRFITSRVGLASMAEKYEMAQFGRCPRILCTQTPVLPVGISDVPEVESVKLFCPQCLDIYNPPSSRYNTIDGAYFGTTFPHLLFMTFPELLPESAGYVYDPRIFGFKVSERSKTGPRMRWLRSYLGEEPTDSMQSDASLEEDDGHPPAGPDQDGKGDNPIELDALREEQQTITNARSSQRTQDSKHSQTATPMDCAHDTELATVHAALYADRGAAHLLAVEA